MQTDPGDLLGRGQQGAAERHDPALAEPGEEDPLRVGAVGGHRFVDERRDSRGQAASASSPSMIGPSGVNVT